MNPTAMNQIAWRIIEGFTGGVAVLTVLCIVFGEWRNIVHLCLLGVTAFVLIFGALFIGKIYFPF